MLTSKFGFSGAALLFLLAGPPAARAADEVVTYKLRAVTVRGAEFTGLVPRTRAFDDLFDVGEGGDSIDPAELDPKQRLKLSGVNGLSGTATFYYGGLKSIQIVGTFTEQELKQLREAQNASRKSRLEREQIRLRKIRIRREAARQEDQREQQQPTGKPALSEEHRQWIDRFPPDKGWSPARKARLYYQTVILNNRAPTDDERAWLDAYDQWKPAYDAWLVLEKQKLSEEPAAQQPADIDPAAPIPEEQKHLPPALDPGTPKPEKVSDKAPKPVPLKPNAVPPDPLQDGSRPRRS